MLNTVLKEKDYKLYVVTPNTHWHLPIAMPRVIVPGQMLEDKALIPLEPIFKQYPVEKFEWLRGSAQTVSTDTNAVTVRLADGSGVTLEYHTLIVATGARSRDGLPWKIVEDTEKTREALHKIHEEIGAAKSIAVIGGGQTGVETAAELGEVYSKHGKKEVYFIYSETLPLHSVNTNSVRNLVANHLAKDKVKLIPNTKVTKVTRNGKDIILELTQSDGSTSSLTVQASLATTGLVPNTSFMPASTLDDKDYIKQTNYLQVEGYSNIFVIGDAGNLEASSVLYAGVQADWLIKNLPRYLVGERMESYVPDPTIRLGLALGPKAGTGQFGNWKLPGLMIWWLKSRHLGAAVAEASAIGKRTALTVYEK
jgi:NADH dehydrogenase FAD-containing subunit